MSDIILQDILCRLRNTFGIDSELSNVSQRLHVLVSLLGIYDSNWCLESLPVLIGSHADVEEEPPCLEKEERSAMKRWLQRLDLGYLVGPKKIEEFCASKKKCQHLLSVFMDKIEQHHGTNKLKANIRLLIQKQSRIKVRSSSLNLSKKKNPSSSSSLDGSAKLAEGSFEEIFHGSQIPRTPSKQFSSSSPTNSEESDKNKTFELANELSITPLTFVKDFEDLPYDNSNKRSSHYRRSSFDKNIIPTGRQIPNTPTHNKSGDTTYTILSDNNAKSTSSEQSESQSAKRPRSPSNERITNYVLDEPESGPIWENECDGDDESINYGMKMSVKNIDWEATFAVDKTCGKDNGERTEDGAALSHPFQHLSLSNAPEEQPELKAKPTRSRKKKEVNPPSIEHPVRLSGRKKTSGEEDPAEKHEKKVRGRPRKNSKLADGMDTVEQEEGKSVNRSHVKSTSKRSDKENAKPADDDVKDSAVENGEEGRVLRRSTRSRRTNLKSLELSPMSETSEAASNMTLEPKKRAPTRKKKKTTSKKEENVEVSSSDPKASSENPVNFTEVNSLSEDSAFKKTTKKASKTRKYKNKS